MNPLIPKIASMEMPKILIAACVCTFAYYYKVYDNGDNNRARIAQLQVDIQTETTNKKATEEALKEVERMRKSVGDLGNKYQDLIKKLPADLTSLEINRAIDEYSRDAGINITARKPESGVKNEIYLEELVTVEAEGDYSKIAQFIYYISRAERLMSVKSFNITKAIGEDDTSSLLKFQGTVINYKLSPEPTKSEKDQAEEGAEE